MSPRFLRDMGLFSAVTNPPSPSLNPDHDHARPNPAPDASDARAHPTTGDSHSSIALAPHAVRDARAPPACCDAHDAQSPHEVRARHARCAAGIDLDLPHARAEPPPSHPPPGTTTTSPNSPRTSPDVDPYHSPVSKISSERRRTLAYRS